MTILSYNYQDLFTKIFKETTTHEFNVKKLQLDTSHGLHNFLSIFSAVDNTLSELARKTVKAFFENLDYEFRYSPGRTSSYHVSAVHFRTIMTIFGLITYERTFYKNIHTKESYCHVDSFLGLRKYDHFDPYIKSLVVEASCDTSFAAAGRCISALIGERVVLEQGLLRISRQTARAFTLDNVISKMAPIRKKTTPEILYIMFDEKFIHTQNNSQKDVMVRHAVIFEGIQPVKNHKWRYTLVNKHVMASSGTGFNNEILDYIYDVYDIKDIKRIYVLGDGAGWIKNSVGEFKLEGNTALFALDKYHFKQALRLITLDDELSDTGLEHILADEKESFIELCNTLAVENDHREKTITEKRDYILNNWAAIRLSYHDNLSCCMEGQISHNLAALFTSRPKGYSPSTISKLLKNRIAVRNGFNIRKLFLNNFNCSEEKVIGKDHYDFSIFDCMNKLLNQSVKTGTVNILKNFQ